MLKSRTKQNKETKIHISLHIYKNKDEQNEGPMEGSNIVIYIPKGLIFLVLFVGLFQTTRRNICCRTTFFSGVKIQIQLSSSTFNIVIFHIGLSFRISTVDIQINEGRVLKNTDKNKKRVLFCLSSKYFLVFVLP